jgi:hypothetical protein
MAKLAVRTSARQRAREADQLPQRTTGGARRAGVLDPGRGLEAEPVIRLEHERSGEILRAEPGIEVAEHDLVDIVRADARMLERLLGDAHDEALDALRVMLTERGVGPAHDTGSHVVLIGSIRDSGHKMLPTGRFGKITVT